MSMSEKIDKKDRRTHDNLKDVPDPYQRFTAINKKEKNAVSVHEPSLTSKITYTSPSISI